MKRLIPTFLSILFLVSAFAEDYLPRNSQKAGEHPPPPEEALSAITLPEGFKITLFAGEPDVRQPVAMCLDDRGRLWIAESYSYKEWEQRGEDRILIFEDANQDGRFDKRTVFWSGGHHVSGLTVGHGGVWVCDSPNLLFIPDQDRDDVPDGEPEVVLDGWTTRAGHNFYNGLTWGIDGWLYGRHGITAASRVGPPGAPDSERVDVDCAIWRWHPTRKVFEVVLRGTTNPWGLDWNDLGEMFMTGNVNGHVWHAIPGARYPRMHGQGFLRHVYQRIAYCADHLHHPGGTGDWTKSRNNQGDNSSMGGGHSHCGGMIYLGDNWPAKYRDTLFMNNTHGRRVNHDILKRKGSGYVAQHGTDFLLANQPWYRGVELRYGPDGGVFIADWTDNGECHDNDGVHRASGRVYKVTWGTPKRVDALDLQSLSSVMLAELQVHANEYQVRHARRVLQERKARGEEVDPAIGVLGDIFLRGKVRHRLRAAWTLHVLDALPVTMLRAMLMDRDEHVRAWGVRLACDHGAPDPSLVSPLLLQMGVDDPSRLVRLYLASNLPRLLRKDQWLMAQALSGGAESEQEDQNLPLMFWYGLEPLVAADPQRALKTFLEDERMTTPLHQRFIARRITSDWAGNQAVIARLVAYIAETKNRHALAGMQDALQGLRGLKAPPGWSAVQGVEGHDAFADVFGGEKAMDARAWMALMKNPEHRLQAINALGAFDDPKIGGVLLKEFHRYNRAEVNAAVSVLASRPAWGETLLEAMRKNRVRKEHISASHAGQIRNLGNAALTAELEKTWGTVRQSPAEKKQLIARYQEKLSPAILAKADHDMGREIFNLRCAMCHRLHGTGGKLGPDLTGADRGNLFYLLENIIDPAAVLPDAYRLTVVELRDGRVLSGTVARENALSLTLLDVQGKAQVVALNEVEQRRILDLSTMPEGLLQTLSDEEARDLIGFLQQD